MTVAVWTIVVAAGQGQRFGARKQYEPLGDRRVLDWAVQAARSVSDGVVVVVPVDEVPGPGEVRGGASRSESVRCGLASVPGDADVIVVHDAARPFASTALFRAVIDAVLAGADAAVPGLAVTDTVKEIDQAGRVVRTPDRARLVAVQTPQAFVPDRLRRAHAEGRESTDDASLVEAAGGHVVVVPGEPDNRKLTVTADLEWARARVAAREVAPCG